tara:strand:+ start:101 stop:1039 length:939 start_codon:yes stop_codon:yes gene_type:complete
MGYKMKQDKSPAKNLDFLTTSGTGGGYINPAQQSSGAGAAGAAGGGFGGAGAVAGGVGMLTNAFGEQDPLKQGYGATKALGGAAQGAQMGAALGPYGMAAGALIGGTVAVVNADKEREEAKKQKLIQEQNIGASKAQSQLLENQYGQGRDLESKSFLTKKGEIKMKPIKKLGAITGTMSPNMSMAQYEDEKKFSAIAQELEPKNEIKTNKNFATPGTGFKDNSGTNNQPKTVTSGDRAKNALKKLSVGAVTGAGTSALKDGIGTFTDGIKGAGPYLEKISGVVLGSAVGAGGVSMLSNPKKFAVDKNMNKQK